MSELLDRRYLLREQLGAGAFGQVHRAEHRVLGVTLRQVAVKLFTIDTASGDVIEAILTEALTVIQALDRCPDPIVRDRFVICYDAGMGERPYLVMELARRDLAGQLAAAVLPVATATAYLRQICQGVAFLHELKVVHLDLKPANVLVSAAGSLKIADFGCAAPMAKLVRRASIGGTLLYQPAEVLALEQAGPPADVYALGLICYEMLTGQLPEHHRLRAASGVLGGKPDISELVRLKLRPVRPPSAHNPEVEGHPLEAVVLRALSPLSSDRYPDAGAMLRALEATAEEGVSAAPPESATQRIEALLQHLRRAVSRDDLELAGRLGDEALQLNRSLPDPAMIAELYVALVKVALRGGNRTAAQELAREGLRRRRCTATHAAMADAFAGSDLGRSFAKLSQTAPPT
ncbi:MAG: serine/threonine-protein kinase [Pseudonocardiaceae bacterium]